MPATYDTLYRGFWDAYTAATPSPLVTMNIGASSFAMSVLGQAIEATASLNASVIQAYIASSSFPTIVGNMTFDMNGQAATGNVHVLQVDASTSIQVIFPAARATASLVYPMPTWQWRACVEAGACSGRGACQDDGSCECEARFRSVGYECVYVPSENKQHLPGWARILGSVLVCISWTMAGCAVAWAVIFRDTSVVAYAQPLFLVLIAVGCMVSTAAILTLMVDDGHEVVYDVLPSAVSCQMDVWLYGLGFALTFSALFAKVWRVKVSACVCGWVRWGGGGLRKRKPLACLLLLFHTHLLSPPLPTLGPLLVAQGGPADAHAH